KRRGGKKMIEDQMPAVRLHTLGDPASLRYERISTPQPAPGRRRRQASLRPFEFVARDRGRLDADENFLRRGDPAARRVGLGAITRPESALGSRPAVARRMRPVISVQGPCAETPGTSPHRAPANRSYPCSPRRRSPPSLPEARAHAQTSALRRG